MNGYAEVTSMTKQMNLIAWHSIGMLKIWSQKIQIKIQMMGASIIHAQTMPTLVVGEVNQVHCEWFMFRSSHFWFLVTFDNEVMKIRKYYVIFVYILQGKMEKTGWNSISLCLHNEQVYVFSFLFIKKRTKKWTMTLFNWLVKIKLVLVHGFITNFIRSGFRIPLTLCESPEIWTGQNRSPIFWYVVLII